MAMATRSRPYRFLNIAKIGDVSRGRKRSVETMFRDSDGEFQGAVAELVLSSESFSEKDSDPTLQRHSAG